MIVAGATHIPLLLRALLHTTGTVLELGAGSYSSPLIGEVCKLQGRDYWCVEESEAYAEIARPWTANLIIGAYHTTEDRLPTEPLGLLFLDHAPDTRRLSDYNRLREQTTVTVLHDWPTDTPDDWDSRYAVLDLRQQPATAVFSDHDPLLWCQDLDRLR